MEIFEARDDPLIPSNKGLYRSVTRVTRLGPTAIARPIVTALDSCNQDSTCVALDGLEA